MGIGTKLAILLDQKETNPNELAKKVGVSPQTIYSIIKRDSKKADIEVLLKIADILGVSVEYFIDDPDSSVSAQLKNFSSTDIKFLETYHSLDEHGRKMVDSVLSHESDRVKALEDQARKILELQRAIIPRYIMAYYEKMASAGSGEYLFDDIPTDLIEVPDCPMAHNADFVIGVAGRSMEPTYCDGDKVYVKKMAEIPTGSIGIFVRGNECFIKELGVDRLISHNKKYPDIPASDDIRLVGKVLGKVEES